MSTAKATSRPLFRALLLLLGVLFHSGTLSGVTRQAIDFQLLFFGNAQGKSVSFEADAGTFTFENMWKLPEIINQFSRKFESRTLVVNVGNNEHPDSPVSYLLSEPVFEHFRRFCRPHVDAIGPHDFARAPHDGKIPEYLFGRLWSNVLQPSDQPFFQQWTRHPLSGNHLIFGCFISPALLADAFVSSVPQLELEDPARAWRRFSQILNPDDIPVLICHMAAADFRVFQQTVKVKSILIWVPPNPPNPETPVVLPKTHHFHVEALPPAADAPLLVFAHKRTGGFLDFRSRHPPYTKVPHPQGHFDFVELSDSLLHASRQALHLIPTPMHRDQVNVRWRPDLMASLIQGVFRSDLTLVHLIGDRTWRGRIIYPETVFSSLPHRFIREYEFTGHDLTRYLEKVFQSASPGRLGVAGGKLAFLAGKVRTLQGRDLPILSGLSYRLSLDSSLFAHPSLTPEQFGGQRTGDSGHTLWSVALRQLPLLEPGKGLGQ